MANKFYIWQKFLSAPLEILGKTKKAIIKWMKFLTGSRFGLWKSEKIPVIIDNNPELGYEKKRWFYFLMVPIVWILALWVAIKKKILGPNLKTNTFWFDGICTICREIKETAATWQALNIIYNYKPIQNPRNFSEKVTKFWETLLCFYGTRNRLKLLKYYLKKEIQNFLLNDSEIRLLSIASGSAQGVIEVMAEFRQKGVNVKAIFLDLDSTAIEHSKKIAQKAGVTEQITFINKGANVLEEVAKDFHPQIVEVVGFLEYRPEERAVELIKRTYNLLPPNGVTLISNTNYNIEVPFLYWVVNWPMIYRSPKKLTELLIKGGFSSKNIKIIYEPLKIHEIAICRKPF